MLINRFVSDKEIMEEFRVSESEDESDESFDVYGADPVFESKEELDEFMANCQIKRTEVSEELNEKDEIFFETQKKIKKDCTCCKCEDIHSDDFEHICCQQIKPR